MDHDHGTFFPKIGDYDRGRLWLIFFVSYREMIADNYFDKIDSFQPESGQFGQKLLGKIPFFVKSIYKMTFLDEKKGKKKKFLSKNWKS